MNLSNMNDEILRCPCSGQRRISSFRATSAYGAIKHGSKAEPDDSDHSNGGLLMIGIAPPIGHYAPDFELPDTHGSVHHLGRYLQQVNAVIVVVMGNQCPAVLACIHELNALHRDVSNQQVPLIGINANDDAQDSGESYQSMKQFALDHRIQFPYLRDMTQDVVRTFGAEKTPEAFLIDADGRIQYSGAVLPSSGSSSAETPLRTAIAQLLNRQPIAVSSTPVAGCSILWRKPSR